MPGVFAFPPSPSPTLIAPNPDPRLHEGTPTDEEHAAAERIAGGPLRSRHRPTDLRAIGELRVHPRNPREGDIGKIVTLIKANGWHGRVLVQVATPDGEPRDLIIAGNHRKQAAEKCGYRALPWEAVVCTDAEAERIMVADNKASDDASNNPAALLELLTERANDDDLEGTGYDTDALGELEKLVNGAAQDDGTGDPNEGPDAAQFLCVVDCKHETALAALFDELTARGFACKLVT